MALKYYKNAQRYAQEIPLPGSRSLKLAPGYYVFGDFAAISSLSDEGVSEPAEVTATPSLLAFEEDVSLTNLPTVAAQDGKVLMTDGTDVIWGTPADITGGVDGTGSADLIAYWSDENTLAALSGITVEAGSVTSIVSDDAEISSLVVDDISKNSGNLNISVSHGLPLEEAVPGGHIYITAGDAVAGVDPQDSVDGGSIILTPGTAVNGGTDGIVDVRGGLNTEYITASGTDGGNFEIVLSELVEGPAAQTGVGIALIAQNAIDGTSTHEVVDGGNVVIDCGAGANGGNPGSLVISNAAYNVRLHCGGPSKLEVRKAPDTSFDLADAEVADMKASSFTLSDLNTAPANASAAGTKGEIRVTADALYVCVDTNTWVKTALATWA